MTRVFQLFTDLKEAQHYCYNHHMEGVDKLALVKCNIHKGDVYYVMDGMTEIECYIENWKMTTLYIYE